MDAESGDLSRHNNNASTLFSFPLPSSQKNIPLNHQSHHNHHHHPVHHHQHPHLINLQEMLETTSVLDQVHHHHFDNRGVPMYYPSQPSSTYDEGSPDSLRKASPVSFLRNGPPTKRLIDLEPQALHGVDSTGGFENVKGDYYGGNEGYGANPSAQFLRSPPSDYYPMDSSFSAPPPQSTQIHSPAFLKVDEHQGDLPEGGERRYDYTSPSPNTQIRHAPSLIPQMSGGTEYVQIEEGYGKVSGQPQTTIPPQHPPTSTPSMNSTNSINSKSVVAGLPCGNTGSTAIIYPWMKRVHSKADVEPLLSGRWFLLDYVSLTPEQFDWVRQREGERLKKPTDATHQGSTFLLYQMVKTMSLSSYYQALRARVAGPTSVWGARGACDKGRSPAGPLTRDVVVFNLGF
ncbi:unnamed protein product [Mesocestoides corti]|uniref:Velvet domain-containing protein n=1 Tax=Mesocestoides corti TaxID=53468 RepID=A0A158QTT8_MESCO|nr:unnamed protein product [Mesocestoides corti]